MSIKGYAHLDTVGQVQTDELGNTYGLLATVTGVNLKNTGQTTLYTVPNGKTVVVTEIISLVTSANTVAIVPIIRVGKTPNFTEWIPLTTLTGFDAANKFTNLSMSVALLMHQTFASTEIVKVDVQTGATATTLTATFFVFGFLF